jgi:hypothetical protein
LSCPPRGPDGRKLAQVLPRRLGGRPRSPSDQRSLGGPLEDASLAAAAQYAQATRRAWADDLLAAGPGRLVATLTVRAGSGGRTRLTLRRGVHRIAGRVRAATGSPARDRAARPLRPVRHRPCRRFLRTEDPPPAGTRGRQLTEREKQDIRRRPRLGLGRLSGAAASATLRAVQQLRQ